MAGAPPDPNLLWTITSLYRKAADLTNAAGMLVAGGPHSPNPALTQAEATRDQQEAFNCSNRAHALQTVSAYTFPGPAILNQLAADCTALEQAIATSADWAALIAAAAKVRQSMPANTV
jgi:hypothetical protein